MRINLIEPNNALTLTKEGASFAILLERGKEYLITGRIVSESDEKDKSALLSFKLDEENIHIDHNAHSMEFSSTVGPYFYLPTASGGSTFNRIITVPIDSNITQVIPRTWGNPGSILLEHLHISPVGDKLCFPQRKSQKNDGEVIVDISPAEGTYIYRYVNQTGGIYEPETMAVICGLIDSGKNCFFDIGANIGLYSVVISSFFNDRMVHAFEPMPDLADIAKNLAEVNQVNYSVHELALSDESGEADFFLSPVSDVSHSLNPDFRNSEVSIKVQLLTLDQFCEDNQVFPDLIKIDTETTEFFVMRGAEELFTTHRPFVICEVLRESMSADLMGFLSRFGYHYYHISGERLVKSDQIWGGTEERDWLFSPVELQIDIQELIDYWRTYLGSANIR